jgi:hypothetical protein
MKQPSLDKRPPGFGVGLSCRAKNSKMFLRWCLSLGLAPATSGPPKFNRRTLLVTDCWHGGVYGMKPSYCFH